MKKLSEVEPRIAINATNTPGDADSMFRIASPGSYYLTGEVAVFPGKSGIEIASSEVTLDLNGFRIGGYPGSLSGVIAGSGYHNLVVRNGTVQSCGQDGVNLNWVTGSRVEALNIQDCGNDGLKVAIGVTIERAVAVHNGGDGISTGESCTLENCTSASNGRTGIVVGAHSTIRACTARSNGDEGMRGVGAVFVDCTAAYNEEGGFLASNCVVRSCVSRDNSGGPGIDGGNGAHIEGCVVDSNNGDGIRVYLRCIVRSNKCVDNGYIEDGANISEAGGWSRIEDNMCVGGAIGIEAQGSHTLIFRNVCRNNGTNWWIAAGNVYGPIVDRTAPGSPAVIGNAGASVLGTTDPNANFTY